MSGEFFGIAAAYAQAKRAKERPMYKGAPVTLENNPLVDIMNERKREEEEQKRRAEEWVKRIMQTFEEITKLANNVDRHVKEITFNGEVAFVVRETEVVKIFTGKICNIRDLQRAVAKLTNAAMGC